MKSKQIKNLMLKKVTILVTRGTGKVYTTEIAPWHILMVLLILIGTISHLLISSAERYRAVVKERDLLAAKLAELQVKERPQEEVKQAEEPPATESLEDQLEEGKPKVEQPSDVSKVQPTDTVKAKPKPGMAYYHDEKLKVERLKVGWLKGKRGQTLLIFSFNLVNVTGDRRLLSGYIVVVARNISISPRVYGAYPQMDLRWGLPIDYRQGDHFAIRHLKRIKGTIEQPDNCPRFNEIVIYGFSDQGSLLLKEVLKIGS